MHQDTRISLRNRYAHTWDKAAKPTTMSRVTQFSPDRRQEGNLRRKIAERSDAYPKKHIRWFYTAQPTLDNACLNNIGRYGRSNVVEQLTPLLIDFCNATAVR